MTIVNVGSNGQAPKGLSAGTTVRTAGGDYKITSVRSDGSYVSQKVTSGSSGSSTPAKVVSSSTSGTSHGGGGVSITTDWQQNMVNVKAQGIAAMQSEANRAQAIINAGQGTVSTQRYLNQMNALIAGKPIGEVFRGEWDNYSGSSGGAGATSAPAETPSYGTPEWYADQSRLEQLFSQNIAKNEAAGDTSYQQYLAYKSQITDTANKQNAMPSTEDEWMAYAKKGFLAVIGLSAIGVVLKAFGK